MSEVKLESYQGQWVYLGQRTADFKSGKLNYAWGVLDVDGNLTDRRWYWPKQVTRYALSSTPIGSVWEFRITPMENGGISVSTRGDEAPKLISKWEDTALIATWQLEQKTAQALRDAKAAMRKAAKTDDEFAARLAPIRVAYLNAAGPGARAALLAAVIAEITGAARDLPGKPSKSKAKGRK